MNLCFWIIWSYTWWIALIFNTFENRSLPWRQIHFVFFILANSIDVFIILFFVQDFDFVFKNGVDRLEIKRYGPFIKLILEIIFCIFLTIKGFIQHLIILFGYQLNIFIICKSMLILNFIENSILRIYWILWGCLNMNNRFRYCFKIAFLWSLNFLLTDGFHFKVIWNLRVQFFNL